MREEATHRNLVMTQILRVREGEVHVSVLGSRVDAGACHREQEHGWRSGFVGKIIIAKWILG